MPRFKPIRGLKRKNWLTVEIFITGVHLGGASHGKKRLKLVNDGKAVRLKVSGRLHNFTLYVYERGGKLVPYIEVHERFFE